MKFKQAIDAADLDAYLSDNRLWVDTYDRIGLRELTSGFIPGKTAPKTSCPFHGGKSGKAFGLIARGKFNSEGTGLGVCNSCGAINGYKMVMEITGWKFPKMLEELAIASGYMDGISSGVFSPPPKSDKQLAFEAKCKAEAAKRDMAIETKNKKLWDESFTLNKPEASPAVAYLRNRMVLSKAASLGGEVRLHPGVRYIDMSYTACVITLEDRGLRLYWIDKKGLRIDQPAGVRMLTQGQLMEESIPLDSPKAEVGRLAVSKMANDTQEKIKRGNSRFHRGVPFKLDLGDHPCILSRIRDKSGMPVSLHQTFITHDGRKADVPKVKKLRPSISTACMSGGAVQLCPPTPVIAVAEGLETLLSVESAIGMQGWGLLNASMMGAWVIPKGVKHVYIWEDSDLAGESNALKLAENLESVGIKVTRCNPKSVHPSGDMDWNDILVNYGPEAFPHANWLDDVAKETRV